MARGDVEGLREAAARWLDLSPEDPDAHFMAALAALANGDRAQALGHLDDARARGLPQDRHDELVTLANRRSPLETAGAIAG